MNICKKCMHTGVCSRQSLTVTQCIDFSDVKNYRFNMFTTLKPCVQKVVVAGIEIEAKMMKCEKCGKKYNLAEAHEVLYCSRCGRERTII